MSDNTSSVKQQASNYFNTTKGLSAYAKMMMKGRFAFLPFCELRGKDMLNAKNYFDILQIRMDTTDFNYKMAEVNGNFFVIADHLPSGSTGLIQTIYHGGDLENDPYLSMYQYARKYSKYCFALKITEGGEPVYFIIMAYLDKNKLKVLGFAGWDKWNSGAIKLVNMMVFKNI